MPFTFSCIIITKVYLKFLSKFKVKNKKFDKKKYHTQRLKNYKILFKFNI